MGKRKCSVHIVITNLCHYQRHVRHEKLTEVSVSYFFRTDDYTVVMETLGMKYGKKKNTKESNKDCKSYVTIDLSFKLKLKLIVFFISQFYA